MTVPARSRPLESIQCLRGLAAMLVVLYHARDPAPWLFNPLEQLRTGMGAVDIFFIISGFIMVVAARNEPLGAFIRRRIIRVAPFYWLATLVFVATMAVWHPAEVSDVMLTDLIKSLLFIPYSHTTPFGLPYPVLLPGWTLVFEMIFYAVFAIGIALGRPVVAAAAILCLLMASGMVFAPANALAFTYTSPLLARFLAGMFVGQLYLLIGFDRFWPLLPIGVAGLIFTATPFAAMDRHAVIRGLSAMALVMGALACERQFRRLPSGLPLRIGNASYSIYLSHWIVLATVKDTHRFLPAYGWIQFLFVLMLVAILSAALGLAVHRFVEAPLIRALWARLPAKTPIRSGVGNPVEDR